MSHHHRRVLGLALILVPLTACGGSGPPPQPGTPPPAFAFDAAVIKAASDPKFASFTRLVDARGAAAKALRDARSKMGETLTDADRATIAELDGKVNAATIAAKAAMASDTWTEEDRKVLRYLFTTKGTG